MEYAALIGIALTLIDKAADAIKTAMEIKGIREVGGKVPQELIDKAEAMRHAALKMMQDKP